MEHSGIEVVTDRIVSTGVTRAVRAWCATHPRLYAAAIRSSARVRLAAHGDDIFCLPAYLPATSTCVCSLRADRMGLFLNDFTPAVPLWMAVWHVRLCYRLFGSRVEVFVVDLDTLSLGALLTAWEGTEVRVTSLCSKRRLTACVSQRRRATGGGYSALSAVQQLELLPSPYEDAALAVAESMPLLQRIVANACAVEYLKPLRSLQQLTELRIARTQIRDRELQVLAQLPLLSTLDISACPQLTSLNALAPSPSLRELHAASCERLVRVAQLGEVGTLRVVDFSDNVLLPAELARFLTQRPLRLRMANFSHLRWPRDSPPDEVEQHRLPLLDTATHLTLSYCTIPNVRWLCGAHNLEQLLLNHTTVTDADLRVLLACTPFLRVLTLSFCEQLQTTLDFVQLLPQLIILTISQSSLPTPFPELDQLRRSLTVTVL